MPVLISSNKEITFFALQLGNVIKRKYCFQLFIPLILVVRVMNDLKTINLILVCQK